MGVMNYIKQKKAQFQEAQKISQTKENVRRAESLKDLRAERIRLQGIKRVQDLEAKEKVRVDSLKQQTNTGIAAKSKNFLSKMKEKNQQLNSRAKTQKRSMSPSPFSTGQSPFNQMSSPNPAFQFSTPGGSLFKTKRKK